MPGTRSRGDHPGNKRDTVGGGGAPLHGMGEWLTPRVLASSRAQALLVIYALALSLAVGLGLGLGLAARAPARSPVPRVPAPRLACGWGQWQPPGASRCVSCPYANMEDTPACNRHTTLINGVVPNGVPTRVLENSTRVINTFFAGGLENVQVFLDVRPAGTRSLIHYHPTGGTTCLLEGEATPSIEGVIGPPRTYHPPECFWMPGACERGDRVACGRATLTRPPVRPPQCARP